MNTETEACIGKPRVVRERARPLVLLTTVYEQTTDGRSDRRLVGVSALGVLSTPTTPEHHRRSPTTDPRAGYHRERDLVLFPDRSRS